jgi:hypothetical protein
MAFNLSMKNQIRVKGFTIRMNQFTSGHSSRQVSDQIRTMTGAGLIKIVDNERFNPYIYPELQLILRINQLTILPMKAVVHKLEKYCCYLFNFEQDKPYSRLLKFFYLAPVIVILTNCMPCYYAPNAQNVPLFTERNQANASLGYRIGGYSRGWDIQSAYSVTDHVGMMVNYSHFSARYDEDEDAFLITNDGHFRGDIVEFGFGYFRPFAEELVFETYGGVGWGAVKNEFSDYISHLESEIYFNRYYIQPAIGWVHKNINIAFSTRVCLLNYTKFLLENNQNQYTMFDLVGTNRNPSWLFEPAFTFRAGGNIAKFQIQTCVSFPLDNPDANFDKLSFSLGVVFTIRGKNDKKVNTGIAPY